ncbi:MAG: MBL fold metallo-hydrolase [Pseudomonadota bacterium]
MISIQTPFVDPPEAGEVTQIADGVFWLRIPLPMALNHVNVYVLDDGDGWCVVDTGYNTNKTKEIWETLLSGAFKGKPVTKVVLTHHHPDHIGLVGWFQARGAKLITTRTAYLMGRMLTLDVQDRWPEETVNFYRSAGVPQSILEAKANSKPFNFSDMVHPIALGFHRLAEGDEIAIGGRSWQVHTTGGHAPEHLTLWSKDDPIVIAGDQIILGISPNIGVYPTEPEADPVEDWIESCSRLKTYANRDQFVLSGHKLPFTGLPKRLDQMIENHHSALERLRIFLTDPKTAAESFDVLFGRMIGEPEFGLALVEAMAHMNHLWHLGEVTRVMDTNGAYRFQMKS